MSKVEKMGCDGCAYAGECIEEDAITLGAFTLAPSLNHISNEEFEDTKQAIKNVLEDRQHLIKINKELEDKLLRIGAEKRDE